MMMQYSVIECDEMEAENEMVVGMSVYLERREYREHLELGNHGDP
jgi:hypothetical protein